MYQLIYYEDQGTIEPPREGYVADQMTTKGHGVMVLWVGLRSCVARPASSGCGWRRRRQSAACAG